MDFSITTPSFNMLEFLKCCSMSIADQDKASVEHIVIDGGSTDGTVAWLKEQKHIKYISEPDRGMYDAINKGFAASSGRYVAYLNCDEQYLPGTLSHVREFLDAHPTVAIAFGDALLIRKDGSLISYRKSYPLRWPYIMAGHLYVLSCTMFFRRSIVDAEEVFDPALKDVGDADFVVRLLRKGYRAAHIKRYLSTFCMTGNNMSAGANARKEKQLALRGAPGWIRTMRVPIGALRLIEKFLYGAYLQGLPLEYDVYASDLIGRLHFSATKGSFRWKTE